MTKLKNIKKLLIEIAQQIAQNEDICKLIYNDSSSALEESYNGPLELDALINEHYISFYPPVETGIKDNQRNTFMIILLDSIDLDREDNNTTGQINIYITTDVNHILLTKNRNRLIELADKIINTLEDTKFSVASTLMPVYCNHVMIDELRAGYRIGFNFADQESVKAEI